MTPNPDSHRLDADIIAAHNRDDRSALVSLYGQAAHMANDIDTRCFFLTQAYIFALETDHAEADELSMQLRAHSRL